ALITHARLPDPRRNWPWLRALLDAVGFSARTAAGAGACWVAAATVAALAAGLTTSARPPVKAASESLAMPVVVLRWGALAARASSLPARPSALRTLLVSCSLENGLPMKSDTPDWMAWTTFSLSPRLVTMMNGTTLSLSCPRHQVSSSRPD